MGVNGGAQLYKECTDPCSFLLSQVDLWLGKTSDHRRFDCWIDSSDTASHSTHLFFFLSFFTSPIFPLNIDRSLSKCVSYYAGTFLNYQCKIERQFGACTSCPQARINMCASYVTVATQHVSPTMEKRKIIDLRSREIPLLFFRIFQPTANRFTHEQLKIHSLSSRI